MTKQLIHLSPLGALEIPTVYDPVEPGVPFDVDDDIADSLLEQIDLYQLAPAGGYGRQKVDELRGLAAARGIDTGGLKKPDIIAALEAADAEEAQQ